MATMDWNKARKPKPSLNNGSPWNTNVYKDDAAARKAAADAKAIQTVTAKILASNPHLTAQEARKRAEAWLTAKRKKDEVALLNAVSA